MLFCLLALFPALLAVVAQDLGALGPCAVACVSNVAAQSHCALATPQCLCPHQLDIRACIGQTCPIPDVESSLHAIASFCQTTPPTSSTTPAQSTATTLQPPATSSHSVTTSPTQTTSTTQSTLQSTTTSTTSPSSPSPSSTSTTLPTSAATTTTSTSSPPNTPTPPPPLLSTPSQPQTVVVLSTQFPSTQPFTGNTGGASWNVVFIPHLVTPLLLTALCFSLF